MSYKKNILFTLYFGKSDNNIGMWIPLIDRIDGGPPEGPYRFIVDNALHIYFGDNINKKIKKYDLEGNLLYSSIPIEDIDDFIVDENNCIYVRSGARCDKLIKLDSSGNIIYTKTIAPEMIGTWEGVEDAPDLSFQNKIDRAGRRYKFSYIGEKYQYGVTKIDLSEKPGKEYKLGLAKIRRKHLLTDESSLPSPNFSGIETIYDWLVDGNGNFYGWGEKKREYPIVLKEGFQIARDVVVFKYSSKRKFLCQIQFPDAPSNFLRDPPFQVDAEGNIYCLQFHADRLDVVRYEEN